MQYDTDEAGKKFLDISSTVDLIFRVVGAGLIGIEFESTLLGIATYCLAHSLSPTNIVRSKW